MDIKSILSDSAGQKAHPPGPPRISTGSHTPHSSYDGRIDYTPSSDVSSARPTPYGHQSSSGGGGYFNSHSQSPYPNASASSTPSVGQHSAWGQSPGGQSQGGMSIPPPPHSQSFVSPQPPTPGSQSAHSLQYYQQQYQQLQSPPFQPGNLPHALSRQISPSQYQGPPGTPLGPPIGYPKPSPHRPSSQGGPDHLRRTSVSSMSSITSNHYPVPVVHRRESTSRSHPSQDFGRERSISVSPKTIPRPAPHREMSSSSQTLSQGQSSIPSQAEHRPSLQPQISHPPYEHQETVPAQTTANPISERQPSIDHTVRSSPAMERPIVKREKEEVLKQSLKRSASHLSDAPVKMIKRPRHEKPVWAESARRGRRLNLNFVAPEARGPVQQHRNAPRPQQTNGAPPPAAGRLPFATSISDTEVIPDIVQRITDWVLRTIGEEPAPKNSMFELEAKIGHILDDGNRIWVPLVDSEVLLNTDGTKLRFKSEMAEEQHRHINEKLNAWTRASVDAYQRDPRTTPISYEHPKDEDEFYELTEEGRQQLDKELLQYIEKPTNLGNTDRAGRKVIRVRSTKNANGATLNLIKTRIANREVHCPNSDFDYRLSISLEAGWYGDATHLRKLIDTRGRKKDRMSYTHSAFHVDLTQVSHEDDAQGLKEHELEVELHSAILEEELKKFRERAPGFKLGSYISDMLLNTRVLIREGGPRRH